jgi:DNA-binding XRE family transcriptional regulator
MIECEALPVKTSPLGHTTGAARRQRTAANPEYRRAYDALAVSRRVAYQVLEYRLDHGLTQQQLAELTGTSLPQISRIESGVHNPTLKTLQRIAEVMGKQLSVSFVDADVGDTTAPTEIALPTVT